MPCRSLKSLAWAGAMGLVLASGFAVLVVVLVVLAGIQGRIHGVSLWPNADLTGPSALDQIRGVFSTLPVIALAYVCHYNVHPCVPPEPLTAPDQSPACGLICFMIAVAARRQASACSAGPAPGLTPCLHADQDANGT